MNEVTPAPDAATILERWAVLAVKANGACEVLWPLHETREAAQRDAERFASVVRGVCIEVGRCVVTRAAP